MSTAVRMGAWRCPKLPNTVAPAARVHRHYRFIDRAVMTLGAER